MEELDDWEDLTPSAAPRLPSAAELPLLAWQHGEAIRKLAAAIRAERAAKGELQRWLRNATVSLVIAVIGGLGSLAAAGIGYGRLLQQSESTAELVTELRAEVRGLRSEVAAMRRER